MVLRRNYARHGEQQLIDKLTNSYISYNAVVVRSSH